MSSLGSLQEQAPLLLTEELLEAINLIARNQAPLEACGIILPTPHEGNQVISVPNRADNPKQAFKVLGNDIRVAMGSWLETAESDELRQVILWHSHPNGGIGPSRIDMRAKDRKITGLAYLVVSLTEDGPIPCFY